MPEYAVADFWSGRPHGPSVLVVERGAVVEVRPLPDGELPPPITVLPGVVDHHVHLGLVDRDALADGAVVEVHDLGWDPDDVLRWRAEAPRGVEVRVAGPFHTAPGGYPTGRSWAPAAAVRAVDSPAAARRAVADAVAASYDAVKVTLHAAMPLMDDATLQAIVDAAHEAGLPVAVHAEGPGQAVRAIDAGADLLAHAPWTEAVPTEDLARGAHMTWCSTLAIHDGEARVTAIDNVRRFRAVGGRVVYGTDAGNGTVSADVNAEEVLALGSAGLHGDDLLQALCGESTDHSVPVARLLASPHRLPVTAADTVAWLADSQRLSAVPLKERHVH